MRARTLLRIYVYLIWVVSLIPVLIMVPPALTTTRYMTFPPVGCTLTWFVQCVHDTILIESLVRSVQIAVVSAILSI
ncbi:MAG: hypothetical protein QXI12_11270, partial [Candidatus Methanomethyliaceae archaeon]